MPLSKPTSIQKNISAWFMRKTSTMAVRRVATLQAVVASDIGNVREENQDRVAVARGMDCYRVPFVVAGICDGIGGMKDGARCAATALATVFDVIFRESQTATEPSEWLVRAATAANSAIFDIYGGKGGATLAVLLRVGVGQTYWLTVGDSRVYLLEDDVLEQLSIDDTLAGQLGSKPAAGSAHSYLLQFIGMGKEMEPHIDELARPSKGTILLTSDGIHFLEKGWLSRIIFHSPDPGTCVRRLMDVAKWSGGTDNASIVLLSLADSASIEELDDNNFDLWDPFGELKIISYDQSNLVRQHPKLQAVSEAATPSYIVQVETKKAKQPNAKSKKIKATGRSKDSATSVRNRKEKGAEEPSAPQLQIKFPNKGG